MPDLWQAVVSKKRVYLPHDVVTAARQRIVNTFQNGVKVHLSISGGKDSIVLSDLVHRLILEGEIDPSLLVVNFIDEEAMFDDAIQITKDWRKKFKLAGAQFDWYCIEVKHHSCFNALTQDESFICWDSTQRDVWVRDMPSFAITDHPRLNRRKDSYQDFLARACRDGIQMTGVRTAESVQRLRNFRQTVRPGRFMQPIFDWKDPDVWRYIRDRELDFPETYMRMYQIGRTRREMRISQFFSIDTAKVLNRLSEFDPTLMERVQAREPNAYLASLYWDTEMFRSAGGSGEASNSKNIDFRAKTFDELTRMRREGGERARVGRNLRKMIMKFDMAMTQMEWKKAYSICISGDPKNRTTRALRNDLSVRLNQEMN